MRFFSKLKSKWQKSEATVDAPQDLDPRLQQPGKRPQLASAGSRNGERNIKVVQEGQPETAVASSHKPLDDDTSATTAQRSDKCTQDGAEISDPRAAPNIGNEQDEQRNDPEFQPESSEATQRYAIGEEDGEQRRSPIQVILRRDTESIAGSLTQERDITNHVPGHMDPSPLRSSVLVNDDAEEPDYESTVSASARSSIISRRMSAPQAQRPMNTDPGLPRRPPSLTSSAVNNEDIWPELVPLQIRCILELSLDDMANPKIMEVVIKWYDKDAWIVLHNTAWEWLEEQGLNSKDKWQHTMLQHGSFRVIGTHHDSEPRKLRLQNHVPEVLIIPICGFISNYFREPFYLHLKWHWDALNFKRRKSDDDYQTTISDELLRKKKVNIYDKMFFSKHTLDRILPLDAAEYIIAEDRSLTNLDADEMEGFRHRLQDCNRLLLLCIWQRLSLKTLKRILDHNSSFSDEDWPCEQKCTALNELKTIWEAFKGAEVAFRPGHTYRFPRPALLTDQGKEEAEIVATEVNLGKDKVVPIYYASEEEQQVGRGGFSQVLAVKIDPSYQEFTEDKDQIFALKKFQSDVLTDKEKKAKKYAHEKKVLEMLRTFQKAPEQKHIVTHYAAWSQGEDFFILFPMATGNLATFMNCLPCDRPTEEKEDFRIRFEKSIMPFDPNTKLPVLEREFILWLFTQLKGLGDALYHLHHLMGDGERNGAKTQQLRVPGSATGHLQVTGYHHDIKPDNILVFMDSRIGYGTFKFGDFGSANIVETDPTIWKKTPAFTKKLRGAATYSSPDGWCDATKAGGIWEDGPLTRQADIWTLGCVFLEILIWCLEPRDDDPKTFSDKRADEQSVEHNKVRIDQYWSRHPDCLKNQAIPRKAVLKQVVEEKFKRLKELCKAKNMHAFRDLIDITRKMMSPSSISRIDSAKLKPRLGTLLDNVTTSLRSDPNWYCGDVDPALMETIERRVLYAIPPPSPSTDPHGRYRERPVPHMVPLEQSTAYSPENAQADLQHTQGQWPLDDPRETTDLLSGSGPNDRALRGRGPATLLGAANFVSRSRSSSRRSGALPFRRHFSDPENPYLDPPTGAPTQEH